MYITFQYNHTYHTQIIMINKQRQDTMAGLTRLELATSCVTGRRSNQLSYNPNDMVLSPLVTFILTIIKN